MVSRDCEVCGTTFEVPYPSTRRRTCKSSECLRAARPPRSDKGSRKSEWIITPCFGCGNPVERPRWQARERHRAYCSSKCREQFAPKSGDGRPHRVTSERQIRDGYVWVYVPKETRPPGWRWSHYPEHRQVMREQLGRDLLPDENVHHINGNRADNRVENLELWVRKQPAGQRVADLVAWAEEIIRRYGHMKE